MSFKLLINPASLIDLSVILSEDDYFAVGFVPTDFIDEDAFDPVTDEDFSVTEGEVTATVSETVFEVTFVLNPVVF